MLLVHVFFHFLLLPVYLAGIVSFQYNLIAIYLFYMIINRCPVVMFNHINTLMNYQ